MDYKSRHRLHWPLDPHRDWATPHVATKETRLLEKHEHMLNLGDIVKSEDLLWGLLVDMTRWPGSHF